MAIIDRNRINSAERENASSVLAIGAQSSFEEPTAARTSSTFVIDYTGDALINACIPPHARLIVDPARSPKNGDIVVAVINGRYTVKFLRMNDHRAWLVPANKKYAEVEISGKPNVHIAGVVTKIITDAERLRQYMM